MITSMKNYLTAANGVAEAIKKQRGKLFFSRESKRISQLIALAKTYGVPFRRISTAQMKTLLSSDEHRGFALEIDAQKKPYTIKTLSDLYVSKDTTSLVIILDGITDPRNFGAIIRAADQFAVDAVIVPKRRSVGGNADTLSRTSSGAIEWIPLIEVSNVNYALEQLKGNDYWIWGADITGNPVHSVNLGNHVALVLGREGSGLHRLVRESCDGLIRIPTAGHVDSLNVATAAGILMYETHRQQGFFSLQ